MRKALKAGTSKPQPVKTVTSSVLPYITAGAAVSAVQVTFSETINNDWFKLGKDIKKVADKAEILGKWFSKHDIPSITAYLGVVL